MSHTPALASFDPFAVHPFTSHAGSPRPAAPPAPYDPYHTPSSSPSSSPLSTPPIPGAPGYVQAPQPRRATSKDGAPAPRRHVFETFRPDGRSSPELADILAKNRQAPAWGYPAPARRA